MRKTIYGKWSFSLTLVSLVLWVLFLAILITGYSIDTKPLDEVLGYSAGGLLLLSLLFSLVSKFKKEPGNWKLAPLIGFGLILLVFISLIYLFTKNFAP